MIFGKKAPQLPEGVPSFHKRYKPSRNQSIAETDILAVDLETTGLDPRKDTLLSIGSVPIRGGTVRLDEAYYQVIRPEAKDKLGDDIAAPIHGIRHQELEEEGCTAHETICDFLPRLDGHVLLAHAAGIETGFLAGAVKRCFNAPFRISVIDTLMIEKRARERRNQMIEPGTLRLGALREHYGLPIYAAHHALIDALAAAELFLAQVSHMCSHLEHPEAAPVRDFVSH
ncbi:MAG: exonuclease domain-containing protein [Pseudomonadota bacterium]